MIKVVGEKVWQYFKNEPGKHVVCRIPSTERNGRKQTSVITVAVIPMPPEYTQKALEEKDLEIITQTGKQKCGGTNANCVASAVRIKHKPTGVSVFINGRDQGQNKKEALRILTYRINESKKTEVEKEYNNSRKAQMMGNSDKLGGRGSKTRTYNFVNSRITDHNLNLKTSNIKDFMKGNFSSLFEEGKKG